MTKVAGVLMAAGAARRMGGVNKLWMPFRGVPLIQYPARAMVHARLSTRFIVTGRDHDQTGELGRNSGFSLIHNAQYEEGFGSSLGKAFTALLPLPAFDGALVLLADMPLVTASHLDLMLKAFSAANGPVIIRASHDGERGNPVIIPKALFSEMAKLQNEQSGQAIIINSGLQVVLIEIGIAARTDVDTPEAWAALQEVDL